MEGYYQEWYSIEREPSLQKGISSTAAFLIGANKTMS